MLGSRAESVGVVYLARAADGFDAFSRFAASYRCHPAGAEHELIVLYKGFAQPGALAEARRQFHDLPHIGIELADVGFDIGSYIETCRRVPHTYLCFLNTHTELAAPGWLASLCNYATQDGIGIVGAMGSYESIFDTVSLLLKVIWLSFGVEADRARNLAYYYDFVLTRYHPDWYESAMLGGRASSRRGRLAAWLARLWWYPRCRFGGTDLIWPGAEKFDIRQFSPFPNPHIRSNGFMVRRDRLSSLDLSRMRAKIDANLFESGESSFTAQLRQEGLAAIVVGRDGKGYGVSDWWRSGTFRLDGQANLLLTDNHTRAFEAMSAGARATHVRMTWGDYSGAAPDDFPDLGYGFCKGSLATKNAK